MSPLIDNIPTLVPKNRRNQNHVLTEEQTLAGIHVREAAWPEAERMIRRGRYRDAYHHMRAACIRARQVELGIN